MFLHKAKRRCAIWLTLAALLFSALSPAMASALFADRPDILARVLGVPVISSTNLHAEICYQDTASRPSSLKSSGAPADEGGGHEAHGVVCSFCLTASSVVSLLAAVPVAPVIVLRDFDLHLAGVIQNPPVTPPATRHSRAPPRIPHAR